MADTHVISFMTIYNFFKNNIPQMERGENSYRSQNVITVDYDKSVNPPLIKGIVAASMKQRRYEVNVS